MSEPEAHLTVQPDPEERESTGIIVGLEVLSEGLSRTGQRETRDTPRVDLRVEPHHRSLGREDGLVEHKRTVRAVLVDGDLDAAGGEKCDDALVSLLLSGESL